MPVIYGKNNLRRYHSLAVLALAPAMQHSAYIPTPYSYASAADALQTSSIGYLCACKEVYASVHRAAACLGACRGRHREMHVLQQECPINPLLLITQAAFILQAHLRSWRILILLRALSANAKILLSDWTRKKSASFPCSTSPLFFNNKKVPLKFSPGNISQYHLLVH